MNPRYWKTVSVLAWCAILILVWMLAPANRTARGGQLSDAARSGAVDFEGRFTGKTLRFDYFHNGSAKEEHISLDELRAEGDWPGSRTRLVDELGLGNFFFEVVDPKDNRVAYSRGFDSVFGEWQTTAEATTAWRTFHESQRFPEPRGEVRLVLKRRESDGEFREIYSANFRPSGPGVNRSPVQSRGQPWPVIESGGPANKVDLLILGDGFAADERDKFHGDVRRLTGILFDTEPFRSHKVDFNIWALEIAAPESGISDPRRGLWRDSPFGFRSNAFGIDRYALSYDNRSIREAAAAAPYDALVVITNTHKHTGGGIYNLWANAPADSPTAPYVFVHELGHSLAGLEDEYYNAEVAYLKADGPPVEPWRPNVTALLDPAKLKWRDLVDPDTPLPTPWNQAEFDRLASRIKAGSAIWNRAGPPPRRFTSCISISRRVPARFWRTRSTPARPVRSKEPAIRHRASIARKSIASCSARTAESFAASAPARSRK